MLCRVTRGMSKFPHGTQMILDHAGHMLHIEQRKKVQLLVEGWLMNN